MSARLDQEREAELQPYRMESCQKRLEELGFTVRSNGSDLLSFEFEGSKIQFWPYSGWHSGRTIVDGRGFNKLLRQLK